MDVTINFRVNMTVNMSVTANVSVTVTVSVHVNMSVNENVKVNGKYMSMYCSAVLQKCCALVFCFASLTYFSFYSLTVQCVVIVTVHTNTK